MKGDFSKLSFNKNKHYSSVRMQQGRVQIDADWNEQMDILDHRLQAETVDFIGGSGAPNEAPGFNVTPTADQKDLKIGKGRYYVNGLLCEREEECPYSEQIDYPDEKLPVAPGSYVAYLDVWQQHITALNDPEIREVALGGPDTTTRLCNRAPVKLLKVEVSALPDLKDLPQLDEWKKVIGTTNGTLTPKIQKANQLGNQLYRVEIHQSGDLQKASFKWSRDNAAIAFDIVEVEPFDPAFIQIIRTVADEQIDFGAQEGKPVWVELSHPTRELRNQPGIFAQVKLSHTSDRLQVSVYEWPGKIKVTPDDLNKNDEVQKARREELKKCTFLRIWDSEEIFIKDENFRALEQGLEIKFNLVKDKNYRAGDYWLIPARTSHDYPILWPRDGENNYLTREPHGIKYHAIPVAGLELKDSKWEQKKDYRVLFSSISKFKAMDAFKVDPALTKIAITIDKDANIEIENNLTVKGFIKAEKPIDGKQLADKTVSTDKLTDKAVTSDKLADKAITSDKLIDGTVTIEKLASKTSEKPSKNSVIITNPQGYLSRNLINAWKSTSPIPRSSDKAEGLFCSPTTFEGVLYLFVVLDTKLQIYTYHPIRREWSAATNEFPKIYGIGKNRCVDHINKNIIFCVRTEKGNFETAYYRIQDNSVHQGSYSYSGSINNMYLNAHGGTLCLVSRWNSGGVEQLKINIYSFEGGKYVHRRGFYDWRFTEPTTVNSIIICGKLIYCFANSKDEGRVYTNSTFLGDETGEWKLIASRKIPIPLECSPLAVDHFIYLVGGKKLENNNLVLSDQVCAFNTQTGKWEDDFQPMPEKRSNANLALYDDKIYVLGGKNKIESIAEETSSYVFYIPT